MKALNLLTTFTLVLITSSMALSQVAEKTLVKSFNLQGNQTVDIHLQGNVEIQEWNSDIMRIEMIVSAENISETTLKSLIKAGRYNLKSKTEADALKVYAPGMEREIRIKGSTLIDNVSYVVNVPSEVLVRLNDEATAELADNQE